VRIFFLLNFSFLGWNLSISVRTRFFINIKKFYLSVKEILENVKKRMADWGAEKF